MGRRKKEPKIVHRQSIASAAQRLFAQRGIEATTMDEIAGEAGYSKATLYVYFKNKEEIIGMLVLESMKKLYDYLSLALEKGEDTWSRYWLICHALLQYQEEFPFYFEMVLDEISIDFDRSDCLPEEVETFRIGEKVNEKIEEFLREGIEKGELRAELDIKPAIFSFWGMLAGLIRTASKKEEYINKNLNLEKLDFLRYGFELLYPSVAYAEKKKRV